MATASLYPLATKEELRKQFVGKNLKDVATPAAVLDISKVKQNCEAMLEAAEELKFGWRAHIKTHKTTELTRLQVGEGKGTANIIVSTLIEAENVAPLLVELRDSGREVNLLYSFPITPAAVSRLAAVSTALGPNGLSLLVDHSDQLLSVTELYKLTNLAPQIFLKINMGGNRAGVIPSTPDCDTLVTSLLELSNSKHCTFHGLYSHAGHSYASQAQAQALNYLRLELEALLVVTSSIHAHPLSSPTKPLILSVGATPTTTSVRNLLLHPSTPEHEHIETPETLAIHALRGTLTVLSSIHTHIEIHAGVYPILDVQQLATHALPTASLSYDNLALTILAEVASLYPSRGLTATPTHEALISCGSLAIGRETCKAYPGFGILTPWNRPGVSLPDQPIENHSGWALGRISQEHGILTWLGEGGEDAESVECKLAVGQQVRVWPNHACIAGAGYGWYLVVDGGREGKEDEIVDVWPRWRGW